MHNRDALESAVGMLLILALAGLAVSVVVVALLVFVALSLR